ncbi:hypothetical protein ABIB56_002932 [Glaciihabitans sp. UYNi722]
MASRDHMRYEFAIESDYAEKVEGEVGCPCVVRDVEGRGVDTRCCRILDNNIDLAEAQNFGSEIGDTPGSAEVGLDITAWNERLLRAG